MQQRKGNCGFTARKKACVNCGFFGETDAKCKLFKFDILESYKCSAYL